MTDFLKVFCICGKTIYPQDIERNIQFNLSVYNECKGTDWKKEAIDQLLEGIAEGCGCI